MYSILLHKRKEIFFLVKPYGQLLFVEDGPLFEILEIRK